MSEKNKIDILGKEIDLPLGWEYKKIKDCCEEYYSGKSPQYAKEPTNYRVIGQAANQRGGIDMSKVKYVTNEFAEKQDEKYYLKYKDIILNTLGTGSIGRVGIFRLQEKLLTDGHPFIFRTGSRCVPEYLYYYFILSEQNIIDSASGSTNQKFLKLNDFVEKMIPVPSKEKQKEIIIKIEELFSSLDKALETLYKNKEQLDVYRKAVLKEVFDKCEYKVSIDSICEHVTDGDHMPPPKAEKGIPFIMISNIQNNKINWSNTAFVNKEYYSEIGDKRTPKRGDVLYTVTGSYGIPILVDFDKEFCFQRHIALLRPKKTINQKFLYYALQTANVYQQATKGATGTAQKTVGLGVLRKIDIPFEKDILKQKEMVLEVEMRLEMHEHIYNTVNRAIMNAEAMRQSILKEAFEGRLV